MAQAKKPAAKKQAKVKQLTINKKEALKPNPGTVKSQGKWTDTATGKPFKKPKHPSDQIDKFIAEFEETGKLTGISKEPANKPKNEALLQTKASIERSKIADEVLRLVEEKINTSLANLQSIAKKFINDKLDAFKKKYIPHQIYELAFMPINVKNLSDIPLEVNLFDPKFKHEDIRITLQGATLTYAELLGMLAVSRIPIMEIVLSFDHERGQKTTPDPIQKMTCEITEKEISGKVFKTPISFTRDAYQFQYGMAGVETDFDLDLGTSICFTMQANSSMVMFFNTLKEAELIIEEKG